MIYPEFSVFPPNQFYPGQLHLSSWYHIPPSIPLKTKTKNLPWCLSFYHLKHTPISSQSQSPTSSPPIISRTCSFLLMFTAIILLQAILFLTLLTSLPASNFGPSKPFSTEKPEGSFSKKKVDTSLSSSRSTSDLHSYLTSRSRKDHRT